jgi:two-component system cell cycle response regulator
MPDGRPEKLQDRRSRADAEGVRRDPARPPTDPVGPVSIVLVALTVASCVAVALGAPDLIVAIPAVCAVSLAAIALHTLRRARRAEADLTERGHEVAALESRLVEEAEARQNAESRLAWRSRLGSLRRQRVGDTMVDPESGLLLEGLLFTNVESRIAAGRRRLTPVAVVMFEVLEYVEIDDPHPVDAGTTAGLLQATLREADGAFRLDEGGYCVVLEDTDDAGAMHLARRFGQALEAMAPGAVVRAGVACYPAHGLTPREVLDRADEALDEARRWRQHRIEVARADRTA